MQGKKGRKKMEGSLGRRLEEHKGKRLTYMVGDMKKKEGQQRIRRESKRGINRKSAERGETHRIRISGRV